MNKETLDISFVCMCVMVAEHGSLIKQKGKTTKSIHVHVD